jgi:hypothetical protein
MQVRRKLGVDLVVADAQPHPLGCLGRQQSKKKEKTQNCDNGPTLTPAVKEH